MKTLVESIVNELRLSKASTGNRLSDKKTFGEVKQGDTIYVFGNFVNNRICEYVVTQVVPISVKSKRFSSSSPNEEVMELAQFEFFADMKSGLKSSVFLVNKDDSWEINATFETGNIICVATTIDALKDALYCPVIKKQPINISKYL